MNEKSFPKWILSALLVLAVLATGFASAIASKGNFEIEAIWSGFKFGLIWMSVWVVLLAWLSNVKNKYDLFIPDNPRVSPQVASLFSIAGVFIGIYINTQFNQNVENLYLIVYLIFGLFIAGSLLGVRVAGYKLVSKKRKLKVR